MTVLSIGVSADTTPANRIDLADGTNFMFPAGPSHFNMQTFKGGVQWGAYERDPQGKGGQSAGMFRTLEIGLLVTGTNMPAAQANLHKLQKVMQQARDSNRFGALGGPVVLVFQRDASAVETYIDVAGGRLDVYDRVGKGGTAAWAMGVLMTLYVRPFYRQAQSANNPTVTIATSSTIVDTCATYRIADTGGDADGLLRAVFTDQSITSKIINRIRIGRRSLQPLGASDFSPILALTATGGSGTSTPDVTARNNTMIRLAGVTNAPSGDPYVALGSAAQPGSGLAQGGEMAVWARVRDSTPYINPLDYTTAPGATTSNSAGTLAPDTYLCRVSAVDSGGFETAAGAPTSVTVNRTAAGVIDTFPTGTLTTTYAAEQLVQSGYTGGQNLCSPDAAYEGAYGYRSNSITPLSTTSFTPSVNRLHKTAYDIAGSGTGTQTIYTRFRINTVPTADPSARSFIAFVYNDSLVASTAMPGATYGVIAGLLYIGNNVWQTIAPSVSATYITLVPGQWYTAALNFVVSAASSSVIQGTISLSINGQALLNALAYNSATTGGITLGTLKCGVGTVIGDGGGSTAIAANDVLSVDFDTVGASQTTVLCQITPTWSAATGASTYNLYTASALNPNAWYQTALGNVLTTTLSAPFTNPPGVLPQSRLSGTAAPALVRVVALPPNSVAIGPVPSSGGQPLLAQSRWEWINLGTILLPAIPWQDAVTQPPGWVLQLQVAQGGINLPTFDCDTLVLFPVDEDQLSAETTGPTGTAQAVGPALPSLGVWTVDFNRSERTGVTVVPAAGGTATSYASVIGRMAAGEGDTELIILTEVSDGAGHFVSDCVNTKFTVGAVISPRYESI